MSCCDQVDQKKCKVTVGNIQCGVPDEGEPQDQLMIINGLCPRAKLENFLAHGAIRRWTELVVPEVLCIPPQKPDVEQLISISSRAEIISQRVIVTPLTSRDHYLNMPVQNQEGTMLTGRKLIIEGVLQQKIVYAAVPAQSVHSVNFDVPFSTYIILDPHDQLTRKFKIDTCIEDIFITNVTARKIFKNVALVIRALPLVC